MIAAQRCELTDVLPGQCAHCRDRDRKDEVSRNWVLRGKHHRDPRGPWFEASFGGECDGCGGRVEVGDRIRSDGEGGWICTDCGEQ